MDKLLILYEFPQEAGTCGFSTHSSSLWNFFVSCTSTGSCLLWRCNDPLDKEISLDSKSFKKNPFSKLITADEKLGMILRAAYFDSKLTKDEFKNRVDLILS